jgi:hypothetical protein
MMGVYLKKKKGSLCSTASYGAVAYILKFPNGRNGGKGVIRLKKII